MRISYALLALVLLASCANEVSEAVVQRTANRVLLFSETDQLAAPAGQELLHELQQLLDWQVDTLTQRERLLEDSLKKYSAVWLFQIEEDSTQSWHHTTLERYLAAGGGLVITDTSKVTRHLWPWYEQFTDRMMHRGILFPDFAEGSVALTTNTRMSPEELGDLLAQVRGDNRSDYARPGLPPAAPHANRFTRKVLDQDIYEPMELVVLPNRKVLFLERRGKMKLYDPYLHQTKVVTEFDVCIDGNYEDGLHGVALDPGYGRDNHWIYVYYSPRADCTIDDQYLSRFEFRGDSLDWASEKVVLKVGVQRETCCHSGGSVEFGPDGNLYLSTGDNTSSKESDGYSPLDERPGRAPFDAQKSSGNTQDLRGKILRIRPEPDGTYRIPDGNLFPDGANGRPEIYAMGVRSPFRFSIDPKTNWLYWGDVGPDVGRDGKYGPQSYDEWNQAKAAGNFGWPYFMADNKAFRERDFATDQVGDYFDPERPINDSPNNTGARELPPAQPAWIWYPYGPSAEFPLLGEGSRSSMAGPWYDDRNQLPVTRVAFPDYYKDKMFIYEWARSWIKVAHLDSTGNLTKLEPFVPASGSSKPIDLEFGPDGALYILEYGAQYFMDNPDARLVRYEYTKGNRAPQPALAVDAPAGAAPHTVTFDATGSFDYDAGDSLTYRWDFGTGNAAATGQRVTHTYSTPGSYTATLTVRDAAGAETTRSTRIRVGNAPPKVALEFEGNRSFYFPGERPNYSVALDDDEDRQRGGIDPSRAVVNVSYVPDEDYLRDIQSGRTALPDGPLAFVEGLRLINESDCRSCHHEELKNIGPSYRQVAQRYAGQYTAVEQLSRKIILGGNGNWGEKIMSGHPQLRPQDAAEMVRYILSLEEYDRLPLRGPLPLNRPAGGAETGGYLVSATYKDRGANGIGELTGRDLTVLRAPRLPAESADVLYQATKSTFGDNREFVQVSMAPFSYLVWRQIDLTDLRTVRLRVQHWGGGYLSLHIDDPEGEVLTTFNLPEGNHWETWQEYELPLQPKAGVQNLYLVHDSKDGGQVRLDWMEVGRR